MIVLKLFFYYRILPQEDFYGRAKDFALLKDVAMQNVL
jgi:hypothetical protein